MPTWNGLMGPKAEPTMAAPALIETAVSGTNPRREVRMKSVGISAMISSCMFSSTPPVAKAILTTGMTRISRF